MCGLSKEAFPRRHVDDTTNHSLATSQSNPSTRATVSTPNARACATQSIETREPSNRLPGDHSVVEPPDPFPNSEVKRNRADGSVHKHARVGHRQGLYPKTPDPTGVRRFSLRARNLTARTGRQRKYFTPKNSASNRGLRHILSDVLSLRGGRMPSAAGVASAVFQSAVGMTPSPMSSRGFHVP